MDFEIEDGILKFEGLEAGTIVDGKVQFDFDVLRQIVVASSRFVTGRKIENRTTKELLEEVSQFVDSKNESLDRKDQEIEELKRDLHNAGQIIKTYEDRCDKQNHEIHQWRTRYIEAARTLEAQQKGV